jgi:phosphonate transport system permease protein
MRYHFGWELFWFTLDSPFYGKSLGELAALVASSDRVVADKSNLAAMASDVWNNRMWQHKDVMWAIFETILMAFLGTMGAGLVALPLAFAAARNFSPYLAVRAAVRRVFDLLRGVDALIWTLVLARAFGPGPMTGALAILLTDTGTFGKLFSEALENVDKKQTRSATVIGAITGGGIGLLLTQAMITQKDWEEVSYYIILILLMVMLMDTLSGWLRRKLITSDDAGH